MEVESRTLWAEIEQSMIMKAFMICLFLGNWAMTIGSVYTTALVASERLEANSVVAALPFSALLAIPAIRSLYVSSQPLGISIGKPHVHLSFRSVSQFDPFPQMQSRSLCRPQL